MFQVLSNYAASITELKKNPSELIESAQGETIAILNRNIPTAYLVSPEAYETLLDALDELELINTVKSRQKDMDSAVEVDLDDL